jgi:hypothetical protein
LVSGRGDKSDPDNAYFSLRSQPCALHRLLQLRKPAGGFSLKCCASRSENCLSPVPLKKLCANFIFERLNLQAQGGLAYVNYLRRTAEIQRLGQG